MNFPFTLDEIHLKDFLNNTNGKIFGCWFVKRKDGNIRRILCRIGVKKNLKNIGLDYDPLQKNLFLVYDLCRKNYRFLPMENILCIRFKNKNYRVIRERQTVAA